MTTAELEDMARSAGFSIQHDCGGYRVAKALPDGGWSYVYPDIGICPAVPRRECGLFLRGYLQGKRDWQGVLSPVSASGGRRKFIRLGSID